MPELPDVEVYRRYAARLARGKKISSVSVYDPRIIRGSGLQALENRLRGRSIARLGRHGKNLFLWLDRGGGLAMHFGMTGRLKHERDRGPLPPHTRFLLRFRSGDRLDYVNQRGFGSVAFTAGEKELVRDRRLGPDALEIPAGEFAKRLDGRRGAVKAALMDQSLVAGIGNVYSDEILFQARIHPKTPCAELSADRLKGLYRAMRRVLKESIRAGADRERMPSSFLTPRRRAGAPCPRCGGPIQALPMGGRTGCFCPRCQPREAPGRQSPKKA